MKNKTQPNNFTKSFYMREDVDKEIQEFKNTIRFDISDSQLINYLLTLGLIYIEKHPEEAGKLL